MTDLEKKERENEARIRRKQFVDKVYGEYIKAKREDEENRMRDMRSYFRRAYSISKGDFYLFQKAFKDFEYDTFCELYPNYESKTRGTDEEFAFDGYRFVNLDSENLTELQRITDLRQGNLYRYDNGELTKVTDIQRMLPMELLRLCDEIKLWRDVKPKQNKK